MMPICINCIFKRFISFIIPSGQSGRFVCVSVMRHVCMILHFLLALSTVRFKWNRLLFPIRAVGLAAPEGYCRSPQEWLRVALPIQSPIKGKESSNIRLRLAAPFFENELSWQKILYVNVANRKT